MGKEVEELEGQSYDPSHTVSHGLPTEKEKEVDDVEYPTGLKLWLVMISLCLSIFLVALDQTIIAPALGAITNEYKSTKEYAFPVFSFIFPYYDDVFQLVALIRMLAKQVILRRSKSLTYSLRTVLDGMAAPIS